MVNFAEDDYLPFLKWKQGEYTAFFGLSRRAESRVKPLFVMPPAGDHDHEAGRPLTPIEHIRSFGRRLAANRGRRLSFIDALHVDDERHATGLTVHPLTELLERALISGAIACPITGLRRSAQYQRAVARFVAANPGLPICIRLNQVDLEGASFEEDLRRLLRELGAMPYRSALVLDLGYYDGHAPDDFATALAHQISSLPHRDDWSCLALAVTSFPESLSKVKAGETKDFPRYDWALYRRVIAARAKIGRVLTFSDYGVEHPNFPTSTKGMMPTAHFRYSTESKYLVIKGTSTRKPHGYKAIYPVAASLVARPEFMGSDFSAGDRFIGEVALGPKTGSAPCWRRASVNHHLEVVSAGLASVFGTSEHDAITRVEPARQPSFI